MTDEGLAIKTALATRTALTALTSTRIWPHRSMPLVGYKPTDGVALGFRVSGGGTMYQAGLMFPRVQFKVWGGLVDDYYTVRSACGVLVDVLDGKSFGAIRMANMDGLPQVATEQDTDWPFALVFFNIWLAR